MWAVLDRLFDCLFGSAAPADESRDRWLVRYLALAGTLALIVIGRRPASILNAQFWGDDNALFYQQLTLGFWPALGHLYAGFPYLAQRLIAALACVVPISRVPLAYNASAVAITALAMATFSLPGFRHLVRNDRLRAAVCLATVCMPAGQELLATLTNVGFFLAIWLMFISVMRAPRSPGGAAGWCVGGALAVFSTPIAPVAVPLWALRAVHGLRKRRRRDTAFAMTQIAALLAVLAMTGTGSAGVLKSLPGEAPAMEFQLGFLWSALGPLAWVTASYVDAAMLPAAAFRRLEALGALAVGALALLVAIALMLALRDLSERGRVTVALAIYLLVSSFYLVLAGRPVYVQLLRGELLPNLNLNSFQIFGARHRALPNVALLLIVAALLDDAHRSRRRIAAAAVACTGLLLSWVPELRVRPVPNLRWPTWAARLESKRASGSREPLKIPSYPPGYEITFDANGTEPAATGQRRPVTPGL